MSCSRAICTTSAIGWIVPISLLAHIVVTAETDDGSRSTPARSSSIRMRPVEQRVVLDRAEDDAVAGRILGQPRPVEPLDRKVVGLGAAGAEHDLAGPRA